MLARPHSRLKRHLSPDTNLRIPCVFIMHLSFNEYLLKPSAQLVDDSQADSLVSAFLLFAFCQLSQQCYDMKKTIAQKASCHGCTQRRGSSAYDANKRACNYRM